MQRLLTALISSLFESAAVGDVAGGDARLRLSRSGQLCIGLGIVMLATVIYGLSWHLTQQLGRNWQLCMRLEAASPMQQDYWQALQFVDQLRSATPAQKLRLKQQVRSMVVRIDGICSVVVFYRSQESSLMAVATASVSVLMLAISIGLPQGLANVNNRTLQAVLWANGFLVVLTVSVLQLGQQSINIKGNLSHYRNNHSIFAQLQTSLANQDSGIGSPQPLDSSMRVARMIRDIDNELQMTPVFSLGLDEDLALQMYGRLTSGGTAQPPSATPPVPQPQSSTAPALTPAASDSATTTP